ncbi:hypothetical protein [Tritonibacter scottomollicae]|uniref:hypothetical protein n=1 Tax=Tritonibacter scottomollicae TaxID=483013 RepID=UPI001A9FD88E|nr:hypothetical protein [Tritonibacter scottomollicae]
MVAAPAQQARLGQQEGTATDGGQHRPLAMTFSQPACQWHCDFRLDRANGESHVGAGQLEVETFETQKGEKDL